MIALKFCKSYCFFKTKWWIFSLILLHWLIDLHFFLISYNIIECFVVSISFSFSFSFFFAQTHFFNHWNFSFSSINIFHFVHQFFLHHEIFFFEWKHLFYLTTNFLDEFIFQQFIISFSTIFSHDKVRYVKKMKNVKKIKKVKKTMFCQTINMKNNKRKTMTKWKDFAWKKFLCLMWIRKTFHSWNFSFIMNETSFLFTSNKRIFFMQNFFISSSFFFYYSSYWLFDKALFFFNFLISSSFFHIICFHIAYDFFSSIICLNIVVYIPSYCFISPFVKLNNDR